MGMDSVATRPEPPPTGDGQDVTDLVVRDLTDRREAGTRKYGTPLKTHNGRRAVVDAYQELLDLTLYLRQHLTERADAEDRACELVFDGGHPRAGPSVARQVNGLADLCHAANRTWWQNPHDGTPLRRNVGELLMLATSELAEAMEGHRKGLMDDKLPHRPMVEVELADCLIRIFDMAGGLGLDVGGALVEKLAFNSKRPDHKPESRLAAGGKKY